VFLRICLLTAIASGSAILFVFYDLCHLQGLLVSLLIGNLVNLLYPKASKCFFMFIFSQTMFTLSCELSNLSEWKCMCSH